jgi:hypothetical protein
MRLALVYAIVMVGAFSAEAQAQAISLLGMDSQVGVATAGTVSFPFNFTVDSSANGGADSGEENCSFRAEDDQSIADRRWQSYCAAGDRHESRKRLRI